MPAANTSADSPVPVPVVNEVAGDMYRSTVLPASIGGTWEEAPWELREQYLVIAQAALDSPPVAAAFEAQAKLAELQAAPSSSKDLELAEAQAKLEALLAGEGDLPEGWTEEWRAASEHYHGIWMTRPGANAASTRIAGGWLERRICSPAVRVEEGGEGS